MLYVPSDGKHRPVCGIHARMYREYGGDYVLEELEGDTRMKTAEVIMWLEQYLYLNAGASSKAAAKNAALAIVNQLIDKGVLVVSDATPSKRETA
jgi:hypothetical protein